MKKKREKRVFQPFPFWLEHWGNIKVQGRNKVVKVFLPFLPCSNLFLLVGTPIFIREILYVPTVTLKYSKMLGSSKYAYNIGIYIYTLYYRVFKGNGWNGPKKALFGFFHKNGGFQLKNIKSAEF